MMKKLILAFLVFVVMSGLFLWAKGKDMREIRTEVEIAAPPTKVWNFLTDTDRWEEWSPIINQSSGVASLGSTLNITMVGKEENKDGPQYHPTITHFDAPKYFRWRAVMMAGFIMTNDKVFELEETSTGTRLVHTEAFSGMMVPLIWDNLAGHVPSMLDSMNDALKTLVEENSD